MQITVVMCTRAQQFSETIICTRVLLHVGMSYNILTAMDTHTLHGVVSHAHDHVTLLSTAVVPPQAPTSITSPENTLAVMEEWSSSCVLASAICVALGEVVSFCNVDHSGNQDDSKSMFRGGVPQTP